VENVTPSKANYSLGSRTKIPTIPPFSPSSSFLVISRRYHIAPDSRGHQTPSSNSRTTPRLQPKSNPSASLSHGVDPLSTSHPSTFNIATKIVIKWSPDGTILAASCFNRGSAHVFPIWTGSQGGGIVQPSDMSNEPGSAIPPPTLTFLLLPFILPEQVCPAGPATPNGSILTRFNTTLGLLRRGTPCPPRLCVMRPTSAPPGKKSLALRRIEALSSVVGDPLVSPTVLGGLSSGLPLAEMCWVVLLKLGGLDLARAVLTSALSCGGRRVVETADLVVWDRRSGDSWLEIKGVIFWKVCLRMSGTGNRQLPFLFESRFLSNLIYRCVSHTELATFHLRSPAVPRSPSHSTFLLDGYPALVRDLASTLSWAVPASYGGTPVSSSLVSMNGWPWSSASQWTTDRRKSFDYRLAFHSTPRTLRRCWS
jgi:hypothetical protein